MTGKQHWFRAEWDRKDGQGKQAGYLCLEAISLVARSERAICDGAVVVPVATVILRSGQGVEVSGAEAERLFSQLDRIARPSPPEGRDLDDLRRHGFGDMAAA